MITLSVQLWAFPGHEKVLISYEDDVLAILGDHGAVVLSRVRAAEPGDGPTEVHVIRFATQEGFDGYMADPRRAAMADRRAKAILRTEMQHVDVIT